MAEYQPLTDSEVRDTATAYFNDPRHDVIERRYEGQRDVLRRMATRMDGAVRMAFGL